MHFDKCNMTNAMSQIQFDKCNVIEGPAIQTNYVDQRDGPTRQSS